MLRDAISHVYRRCAASGERPREQLLIDSLKTASRRRAAGANADKLQSLLLRLGPYGQDGLLAHIADSPTTVADDAPLVLFDFTGLSDRLAPALTLAVADFVEWRVHQLRRQRVAGQLRRPVGRAGATDRRGGLEAPVLARRRSVAERVRPPRPALRAVADLHHPVLPRLRLRAGPRAAEQPRRRAVPAQRAPRP